MQDNAFISILPTGNPAPTSEFRVRSSFFARQSPTFHLMTISVIVVHHRMPHASIIKRQRSNTKRHLIFSSNTFSMLAVDKRKGR